MAKNALKYWMLLLSIVCVANAAQSQYDEVSRGFKKENTFLGGSVALGFGSGSFSVGGNPEIGYSITRWMDAGFIFNLNYYSFTAELNLGVRQRTFNYGGGVFARFWPINSLFVTIIPEYNFIDTKLKDVAVNYTGEELKLRREAPSCILGVGYGSHDIGNGSFYTMIGFDAGNNINSPYLGYYGSKLPIIRAGFNVYLRPRMR